MTVFAFDRDWTVDVNAHPSKDSVPLEWVRLLADDPDHSVYAIGNRMLEEEAGIPGVVDVVHRHPDDSERWLGEPTGNGHPEKLPTRKERLSLIADLHPAAEKLVVVDDLDLSYVEGWTHYYPWDFVRAVNAGNCQSDLPVRVNP
ncbi:hypothetical protein [Salinarchaeum sp. Harcht-Bsk1]|uniref:hypothetical protein n=1 Tax=Salinarchaeum sp. Harcht-Bsk1 TaxID=1333523 RepID=UPI000677FEF9|nr:hypothetical protein [Salinarchaeum sp. Harcht-Bsk1]